ncbi:MAG: methylmalonyl-CoA mutase [Candidatus Schekmanbacteria bacterium]|nr:methylmalonyl-CoA mutase [Candidatus Schekmanbacteria bacterium]
MGSKEKTLFTGSGIEIKDLYHPGDASTKAYNEKIGFPGEFPFTRGIQPTMYRGKLWTMRQYAGFGTASETNRRFKYLMQSGQKGLSIAFDLPTQMGLDSDDKLSRGEVGRIGVAVDTLADMEAIFDGIPLSSISTSMTTNAQAVVMLAMYIAVAEKNRVPAFNLHGTVQNDILKEYMARGTYIFPPSHSMRLAADLIEYCSKNLPNWNPISISGYHVREAGCNAVQEAAFMLSDGIAYVEEVLKRGISIDEFAPHLSWIMASGMDLFEEVAKFRAVRRIWAKMVKDRWNSNKSESMKFRLFTATMGSTLSRQEPLNNVVRATLEALASVIGGVQSIHVSSFDEAIGIPDESSVLISLRTQQVLAFESGIVEAADIFGGSYFLEKLTDEFEEKTWEILGKIEKLGGAPEALQKGYFHSEIREGAWKEQKKIETKEKTFIGVNSFSASGNRALRAFKVSDENEHEQLERLKRVKSERDSMSVKASLLRLAESAKLRENIMFPVIECVKAYATIGEVCSILKEELGFYKGINSY